MKTIIRATLLAICTLILTIPSIAQPPDVLWTRTFGGHGYDYGKSLCETHDGGIVTVGTYTQNDQNMDIWLIKTDIDGNELWAQMYDAGGSEQGSCVRESMDNGFIIAGVKNTSGLVIKTDHNGDEVWRILFQATYQVTLSGVIQTADGGYIIIGYEVDLDPRDWDELIVRLDSDGNQIWRHAYGGEEIGYGSDVLETADGDYVVVGFTESYGTGNGDLWLFKTDSEGNELWSRTFAGEMHGRGDKLCQTSDGGFIIAGTNFDIAMEADTWLIKTDSDGNETWNQSYGSEEYTENGNSVVQSSDGAYIILGSISIGGIDNDIWLAKVDQQGNLTWQFVFDGVDDQYGWDVIQTMDEGYLFTGYTGLLSALSTDLLFVRLAADGTEVTEDITSIPSEYLLEDIYPNPFNPTAAISIALPAPSEIKVSVFNTVGQEVAVLADGQYAQGYQQLTFDASGLSSGIYFVQANVPGQMNEMRKIVYLK